MIAFRDNNRRLYIFALVGVVILLVYPISILRLSEFLTERFGIDFRYTKDFWHTFWAWTAAIFWWVLFYYVGWLFDQAGGVGVRAYGNIIRIRYGGLLGMAGEIVNHEKILAIYSLSTRAIEFTKRLGASGNVGIIFLYQPPFNLNSHGARMWLRRTAGALY
jgi:hypothetical protein